MINIIDSFLNFKRANDNFGINISLFEKNIIQTNLFYNPIKDDTFFIMKKLQVHLKMKLELEFQI